jgi:hypothetical protein
MIFPLVLHRSSPLTSAAIMKHQFARLAPNILSHHREGYIGWQHRLIAQKLPHIFRPWAGHMADDLLFSGRAVGCVGAVRGRLGPVLVLCFYGHGGTGRVAWGSGRTTRVERRQSLHSLLNLSIRNYKITQNLEEKNNEELT